MGMETLIYFTLEGAEVCGRVDPDAGAQEVPRSIGSGPTICTC